ncbi:OmpA family protein, partial [Thiomicrospira sp. XS5]
GSSQSNIRLSWNRANSVKTYLIRNFGYASNRIYLNGHGENLPAASNETKEGRQKNRRIELEIMTPDKLPSGAKETIPETMKHYNRFQP